MGHLTQPSLARLQQLLARQDPPAYGPLYIPSTLATREEAPRFSNAAKLWWPRMERYVHAISRPEISVALLVMHYPELFELQEQRMMHFAERPHPLSGHERAEGLHLPPLRGALDVAESLGLMRYYPRITAADSAGESSVLPFVFISDVLCYLSDAQGPYCVNLTVKSTRADFSCRPAFGRRRVAEPAKVKAREEARHLIERVFYESAGIRTVEIAATQEVDPHVFGNLARVLLWQKRPCAVPKSAQDEALDRFRAAIAGGDSALNVIFCMNKRHRSLSLDGLKAAFYRAIWRRELRVDLFHPIHIDKRLRAESRDVFQKYRHWFARS